MRSAHCAAPAQRSYAVAVRAQQGGGASRRRSQRLNQQGRARQPAQDLQRQLLEREAQFQEQQRLRQQAEQEDADRNAAQALQEEAARNLFEQMRKQSKAQAQRRPADAAAAAGLDDGGAATAASVVGPDAVVEPDFIVEPAWRPDEQQQQQQQQKQQQEEGFRPTISRQAQALLEIMQAGEEVEVVIVQRRADIDEEMLRLLEGRIRAAEQLEKRSEVVRGLQLLYRRLKAELDRQRASPALCLLDDLIGILDPDEGAGVMPSGLDDRRQQAAARLRAAFTGGLVGDADVLSLAAQLGGSGGSQVADQLVADPVDPMAFMAETTQLLQRVHEEQAQLEAYLAQGQVEAGAGPADAEDVGQLQAAASAELAVQQAEELLQQRQAAADLVQQCLDIAQAVITDLR